MVRVLDGLLELHRIDQELRDVERETERLPAALAASEQELAALQEKKAGVLEEARDRQVAADKSNVQIRDLEGRIEKYQVQLNIAKTQKEYDTLKHEISTCQEQISEIETGALTAYEEADHLTSRARELAPRIAEVEKSLESQRAELDDRLADLAHRREKLERGRGEHVKGIDEDDLKLYERVRSKHRDGALTRVENGICTICNVKLTPQSYNLVLLGEQLQQCRSCGRLCYSEDAPGLGPPETDQGRNNLRAKFRDEMDSLSRKHGFEFGHASWPQADRSTGFMIKVHGEPAWGLYCLSSTSDWWGITPSRLVVMAKWKTEKQPQANWAVILLRGNHTTGYLVDAEAVARLGWPSALEVKVTPDDLGHEATFADLSELCKLLGLAEVQGKS